MDYEKAKNLGIASLVLGIASLFCIFFGYTTILGVILAIIGIVLGVNARKNLSKEDGMLAYAGLICSIVALVIDGVVLVACIICVGAMGAGTFAYLY